MEARLEALFKTPEEYTIEKRLFSSCLDCFLIVQTYFKLSELFIIRPEFFIEDF